MDRTGPSPLNRFLPGLESMRGYQRSWLRGDILAGVTVAAYLVPQVMAYSGLAGLPPVAGLWAILLPLAVYVLLGSSRHLSVGPESTTALLTATVVAPLAAGDPGRYATLAASLAVATGLLFLLARVARLGFVADLFSKPILAGYLTGVGLIMIIGQLGKITGVPVDGDGVIGEVVSFVRGLGQIHLATVVFAAIVLAFLFLVRWRFPRIPGPLLAVLLATGAVVVFGLERRGISVVGAVPLGLPAPTLPSPADLADLALPALGVMVVGYTDAVLTARSFAARTGHDIDPNQELVALGAANIGAGLLRGFPVSSSASRTTLAVASGARTQAYALATLACVLGVLLVAGPLLAKFPTAALGAIVIYAAVRLIDIKEFRRLAAFRRTELALALAATVGVLAVDILYGILLAIALSVVAMLAQVARPHDAVQGIVPGLAGMHDIEDYPQAKVIEGLVVYRYDSPLFFANAENFRRRAHEAVASQPGPVAWFVLNTEANVEVDITGLDALEELRAELTDRGIVFALARVKQDLREELDAHGCTDRIGAHLIFPTLPTAVEAYRAWAAEQVAAEGPAAEGPAAEGPAAQGPAAEGAAAERSARDSRPS